MENEYWHSFTDSENRVVRVSGKHTYDPVSQIVTYYILREWHCEAKTSVIKLRYSRLEELLALFDRKGFMVKSIYGGLKNEKWEKNSPQIVMVCSIKS